MKKLALLMAVLSTGVISCGGGGGSGIEGRFGSVMLGVGNYDYKPRGTYCGQQVFQDEVIDQITLRSEVIKNVGGQPVTQNPSPVYVDSYKVLFFSATSNNNCERYSDCRQLFASGFSGFVGLSIPPDGTSEYKNLVLVPASWKMATLLNYCLTPLDNCDYNAVVEFHGREIYSGKEQTIRFNIRLSFYALQQCPQ